MGMPSGNCCGRIGQLCSPRRLVNEPFVERDGDGQSFVQTQRLARTDFDAISGDVHVRILCTRAVGAVNTLARIFVVPSGRMMCALAD